MCEAEEELRAANRQIEKLGDKLDALCEAIFDCERGIIDTVELRRLANAELRGVKV